MLNRTGHLPRTTAWDYLHWRRSLDIARFDRYHPFWAGLFRREHNHQVQTPTIPVVESPMPTPAAPGAVPEPGGFTLMAILCVAVGVGWLIERFMMENAHE